MPVGCQSLEPRDYDCFVLRRDIEDIRRCPYIKPNVLLCRIFFDDYLWCGVGGMWKITCQGVMLKMSRCFLMAIAPQ